MANITLGRAVDSNDSATAFNMAKKEFSAMTIDAWQAATVAWDLTTKKVVSGQKSAEFPKLWKMTYEVHEPGADILGQSVEKAPVVVSLEDKELASYAHETIIDRFVSHYDYRAKLAQLAGQALAQAADVHVFRALIAAAKTAASGSFPGGQQLASDRTGATIAAAYPVSPAGSGYFQADLGEIVQKFREDNVPNSAELYCFVSPYLHRVIRQDNTLMSRDYTDAALADKLSGKLLKVEGCWIIESNNIPTTDLSADDTVTINGTGAYMVDCSDVAAVIMGPDAIATVVAEGIAPSVDWLPEKRVWQVGAAMYKGHATFRPECAGVITIAGS